MLDAMGQEHRDRLREEEHRTRQMVDSLRRSFDDIVAASEQVATDDEHDPEGHTIAWERQQIAALLEEAEERLAELAAANGRLDAGDYGRCERCGAPIAEARLEVLPTTTTCVGCA